MLPQVSLPFEMSPFMPKNYLKKPHIVIKKKKTCSLFPRRKSYTEVNKLVAQQIWQLIFDQGKQLTVTTRRKNNRTLKF